MKNINNKEELIIHISQGNMVDFLLFWGHQKPKSGVSKSCFSQWFESSFIHDGDKYLTAEHFMMAEKARLFSDDRIRQEILVSRTPAEAKKLGRKIKDFNDKVWVDKRFEIVKQANYLKFSQNKIFEKFLINTKDRVLVEASPVDPIWGIGLAMDNKNAKRPEKWKGLNLLGFALMCVREELKEGDN